MTLKSQFQIDQEKMIDQLNKRDREWALTWEKILIPLGFIKAPKSRFTDKPVNHFKVTKGDSEWIDFYGMDPSHPAEVLRNIFYNRGFREGQIDKVNKLKELLEIPENLITYDQAVKIAEEYS